MGNKCNRCGYLGDIKAFECGMCANLNYTEKKRLNIMKLLKKLFRIKTTYAIPSDNGVDITKGKKYRLYVNKSDDMFIKDNSNIKIYIRKYLCEHLNGGSWQIITE